MFVRSINSSRNQGEVGKRGRGAYSAVTSSPFLSIYEPNIPACGWAWEWHMIVGRERAEMGRAEGEGGQWGSRGGRLLLKHLPCLVLQRAGPPVTIDDWHVKRGRPPVAQPDKQALIQWQLLRKIPGETWGGARLLGRHLALYRTATIQSPYWL